MLENYQSYDEMELSALIGMSVPTHFINDGARDNSGKAKPMKAGPFERRGVYVGLVGCRFERQNVMESKHMIVSATRDAQPVDAMTKAWAKFYDVRSFPKYSDVHQKRANTDIMP